MKTALDNKFCACQWHDDNGTTTSYAGLWRQTLADSASADAFLIMTSELLTTIPTPSLPACSLSVHF